MSLELTTRESRVRNMIHREQPNGRNQRCIESKKKLTFWEEEIWHYDDVMMLDMSKNKTVKTKWYTPYLNNGIQRSIMGQTKQHEKGKCKAHYMNYTI